LSEAKTLLAPNLLLIAYHCNRTAPGTDEQHQAALAIPQRQIYRWQQAVLSMSPPGNLSTPSTTKPVSTGTEKQPKLDLAKLSFPFTRSIKCFFNSTAATRNY
jgi:hypothetical protein